jgi:hypothetical protein
MSLYARPHPETGLHEVRDFASPPPAGKSWVPFTIDIQPTPLATQVVVSAGIVFTEAAAKQTWALRDKTADELLDDAARAALASITQRIADIAAQREVTRTTWDGYTAAQLRAEQWRDRQALLQSMDDVLKILRRSI